MSGQLGLLIFSIYRCKYIFREKFDEGFTE